MTPTDWLIFAAFWIVIFLTAWFSQRLMNATEAAHYWRAVARIRRDERDEARALLAVAEDVNAMPCQCGCDDERWMGETPVYDRLLVERLHEWIDELERGETA